MLSVSTAGRRKADTTPPVCTGVAVAVPAGAPVCAPPAASSDGARPPSPAPPSGVDAASVGEADTVTPCAPSASVTVVPGGSTVSKELEACSMRQAPETSSAPASSMVMDTAPVRPPATCPFARSSESRLSRVDTAAGASTGTS